MTRAKKIVSLISILTISGCSSFDMDMLNPFSSDEKEPQEMQPVVTESQTPQVSEQDLQKMYKQWEGFQPELLKIAMMESEIVKLKQQINEQNTKLKTISEKAANSRQMSSRKNTTAMSKPANSDNGNYSIQVAAASNMEAATKAWQALLRKHPSFLNRYTPNYERFEKGNSVFYRVKAGAFNTNNEALSSCRNFQSLGGQCMVRKN